MSNLKSFKRLTNLKVLKPKEIVNAQESIETLIKELLEINELLKSPDVASRIRLYAKISDWIKEHSGSTNPIDDCPVCASDLKQKRDVVTGKYISEHIKDMLGSDKKYLSNTLKDWEKSVVAKLTKEMPSAIQQELDRDLPESPSGLIASAMCEELFDSKCFAKSLSPLKVSITKLFHKKAKTLPKYIDPMEPKISDEIKDSCKEFVQTIMRIKRAIAFCNWRNENDEACKHLYNNVIGQEKEVCLDSDIESHESISELSLYDSLYRLDRLVKSATPMENAINIVIDLRDILASRRRKQRRMFLYARATKSIDKIIELEKLVKLQVALLIEQLSSDISSWKKKLYNSAYTGAPEMSRTSIDSDGVLAVDVIISGTTTSSQHISNSSDLRSTLFAILFSFWQYIYKNRSALSLMLLDDLQELFDIHNRRHVADSISEITCLDCRIITTTNDPRFGDQVAAAASRKLSNRNIDRRQIYPLNSVRSHIELGIFIQEINKKRKSFDNPDNKNNDSIAQDYINELRIYLETRLSDFFNDEITPRIPSPSSFSELVDAIRARRNKGHQAFMGKVFGDLLSHKAFCPGEFMEIMNTVHHSGKSGITYKAVWDIKDDCKHACELIDTAHEEHERWLRRDSQEVLEDKPELPEQSNTLKARLAWLVACSRPLSDLARFLRLSFWYSLLQFIFGKT